MSEDFGTPKEGRCLLLRYKGSQVELTSTEDREGAEEQNEEERSAHGGCMWQRVGGSTRAGTQSHELLSMLQNARVMRTGS